MSMPWCDIDQLPVCQNLSCYESVNIIYKIYIYQYYDAVFLTFLVKQVSRYMLPIFLRYFLMLIYLLVYLLMWSLCMNICLLENQSAHKCVLYIYLSLLLKQILIHVTDLSRWLGWGFHYRRNPYSNYTSLQYIITRKNF